MRRYGHPKTSPNKPQGTGFVFADPAHQRRWSGFSKGDQFGNGVLVAFEPSMELTFRKS